MIKIDCPRCHAPMREEMTYRSLTCNNCFVYYWIDNSPENFLYINKNYNYDSDWVFVLFSSKYRIEYHFEETYITNRGYSIQSALKNIDITELPFLEDEEINSYVEQLLIFQ
jgi:hypothetical protein